MTTRAEWDAFAETAKAAGDHARGVIDTDTTLAFSLPAEPDLIDRYRARTSALNAAFGRGNWSTVEAEYPLGGFMSNTETPDLPETVMVRSRISIVARAKGASLDRSRWGGARATPGAGETIERAITVATRLAVLDAFEKAADAILADAARR